MTLPAERLRELGVRPTYRTLWVLKAIARLGSDARPPSNREVARAAGVFDNGQISKLLKRLQSLGLIENTGMGEFKGKPNAWRLTAKGDEVKRVLEAHARDRAEPIQPSIDAPTGDTRRLAAIGSSSDPSPVLFLHSPGAAAALKLAAVPDFSWRRCDEA
jgi:DNA-binding IclR family transcriptional regulator